MTITYDGFAALVDDFDGFVLDQWGVLHGGAEPYPGVLELLDLLRLKGKRVLVLTNSSKSRARNEARLQQQFGIRPSLYEGLISSAQILRDDLAARGVRRVYVVADEGDEVLFAEDFERVTRMQDAEVLVVLSVVPGTGPKEHAEVIKEAAALRLTAVMPSADVSSVRPDRLVNGLNSIKSELESLGVSVLNYGKPSRYVYDACSEVLGPIPGSRVLMVGDQIYSDVAGAHTAGWQAALVLTGAGTQSLQDQSQFGTPDYVISGFKP